MMEQTVDVMMTSEVGDDWAGWRHEQDRSGMVARETMQHMKRHDSHLEVDAANVDGDSSVIYCTANLKLHHIFQWPDRNRLSTARLIAISVHIQLFF